MRKSSTMPTPAEILQITMEKAEIRRQRSNCFIPRAIPRLSLGEGLGVIPWAFKSYNQIIENELMYSLEKHLAILWQEEGKEKYRYYVRYLKDFCGFPHDWRSNSAGQITP